MQKLHFHHFVWRTFWETRKSTTVTWTKIYIAKTARTSIHRCGELVHYCNQWRIPSLTLLLSCIQRVWAGSSQVLTSLSIYSHNNTSCSGYLLSLVHQQGLYWVISLQIGSLEASLLPKEAGCVRTGCLLPPQRGPEKSKSSGYLEFCRIGPILHTRRN